MQDDASAGPEALKALLAAYDITQREYAAGIDETEVVVSRLLSGDTQFNKERIDKTLVFLTKRTGRPFTYEKAFGSPKEVLHGR